MHGQLLNIFLYAWVLDFFSRGKVFVARRARERTR